MSQDALHTRPLGLSDATNLGNFLKTDSLAFIYPLGWLVREGIVPRSPYLSFHFIGVFAGPRLVGAGLCAGSVLLFVATHDLAAARALGAHQQLQPGGFQVMVGPRAAVSTVWEGLAERGFAARLRRPQVVLSLVPRQLRTGIPTTSSGLRLATLSDLLELVTASLVMHEHETLERPRPEQLEVFRRSLQYQIANRRVFIWTEGARDSLRFKVALSAMCHEGAQLEGVFVPDQFRRRAYAKRGMVDLCRRLFEQVPVVSLYVNEDNAAALYLYEKTLGFERRLPFETIFLKSFPQAA